MRGKKLILFCAYTDMHFVELTLIRAIFPDDAIRPPAIDQNPSLQYFASRPT